jgi:hypothetical protein
VVFFGCNREEKGQINEGKAEGKQRTNSDSWHSCQHSHRRRTPRLPRMPPSVPVDEQDLRDPRIGLFSKLVDEGGVMSGFAEGEIGVDVGS